MSGISTKNLPLSQNVAEVIGNDSQDNTVRISREALTLLVGNGLAEQITNAGGMAIFPTTTAGLAATTDGDYFSVPSEDVNEYLILYRNDSGSAVEISRTPSQAAVAPFVEPAQVNLDWDSITKSGFYRVAAESENPIGVPVPDTHLRMMHIQGQTDAASQMAFLHTADDPLVWVRSRSVSGGWSEWQQLLRKAPADISLDWDSVNESGFYRSALTDGETEGAPAEHAHIGMIHISKGNNYDNQIAIRAKADNPQVWVRADSPEGWGEWYELGWKADIQDVQDSVDSLWTFSEELSGVVSVRPGFLDDFSREIPTTSPLGKTLNGHRWHASSSFEIRDGALRLRDDQIGSGRRFAATGFPFRDYVAHMSVDVLEGFNFGWVFRGPNSETSRSPMLFCRFRKRAENPTPSFVLSYRESGDATDDDTAENLISVPVPWIKLNSRNNFTFVQEGRKVRAFVNSRLVTEWTISEDMDDVLGHSVGVNGFGYPGSNEDFSIARITAYRIGGASAGRPQVFSHRMVVHGPVTGNAVWRSNNPENCLSALEKLPLGIGIETDVRKTSDGHYIIMHDATINRTTYGTGAVVDLTLAEIKQTRIRGLGGRDVPTLEELLIALEYRPDIPEILLQMKTMSDPNFAAGMFSVVNNAPASVKSRCVYFIDAPDTANIDILKSLDPDARIAVGGRSNGNATDIPTLVSKGVEIGIIAAGDSNYMDNRAQVAALQGAGLKAYASTTQFHFTMRQIIEDGADGYLSDYPLVSHV